MLEDGLSFPLRGDSALGRIFIGGLLGLFSILVIPGIALFGYLVRVLEYSARDEEDPPPFEDWGGLLADGLKAIVVAIAYSILPFVLFVFAIGMTGAGFAAGRGSGGGILGGLGIIGILVSVLVLLIVYYLIPAALTNMALRNDIKAAFDVATLKRVLLSFEYFVAWLLPIVIVFFANIVSVLVVVFTIGFGIVVLPFIQFYVQVSVFYMFGRAFGSVVDVASSGGEEPAAGG